MESALYLIVINFLTLAIFRFDKHRAKGGGNRISERNLLTLALVGGSPGALAARRLFRHKTRKQPFSFQLWLIVALQAGAIAGWFLLG